MISGDFRERPADVHGNEQPEENGQRDGCDIPKGLCLCVSKKEVVIRGPLSLGRLFLKIFFINGPVRGNVPVEDVLEDVEIFDVVIAFFRGVAALLIFRVATRTVLGVFDVKKVRGNNIEKQPGDIEHSGHIDRRDQKLFEARAVLHAVLLDVIVKKEGPVPQIASDVVLFVSVR